MKFHNLKVKEVRRETTQTVSVAFEIPAELNEEYAYQAGQSITFRMDIDGEDVRRSYSLCSSPVLKEDFRVAVKKVEGGKMSPFITEELKAGDEMQVMTPSGSFHVTIDANNEKTYVLFAGGSGITPLISILKTILTKEPKSRVILFYANENEDAIIFRDEINQWAEKHPDNLKVFHLLNNPKQALDEAFHGIMTVEKVRSLIKSYVPAEGHHEYLICGPTPMMQNVEATVQEFDVPKNRIHLEYFTTEVAGKERPSETEEAGEEIISRVTVIMDGDEFDFELSSNGNVILDAAIENGVDAPFSCKGAVCATCKAKLLEGQVRMEQNYALTDGEVEEGYILTCQSHPITERVVVDYDVI